MEIANEEARTKAIVNVAWSALERSSEVFKDALRELPAGNSEKGKLIRAWVNGLITTKGQEAAVAWVQSLDGDTTATEAREQIALITAESNPEEAVRLLPKSSFDGGKGSSAAVETVQLWTQRAPIDAAEWAAKLPSGKGRQAGIDAVLAEWFETDATAAVSWIASLKDAELRHDLVIVVAEVYKRHPQPIRDTLLEHSGTDIRAEITRHSKANNGVAAEDLVGEDIKGDPGIAR